MIPRYIFRSSPTRSGHFTFFRCLDDRFRGLHASRENDSLRHSPLHHISRQSPFLWVKLRSRMGVSLRFRARERVISGIESRSFRFGIACDSKEFPGSRVPRRLLRRTGNDSPRSGIARGSVYGSRNAESKYRQDDQKGIKHDPIS